MERSIVAAGGRPGFLSVALDLWLATRGGSSAIAARQQSRLRHLVAFARAHSRFYAEHYRQVDASEPALDQLPPISKPQVLARFDDWGTDPGVTQAALEAFLDDPSRSGQDFLGRYMVWTTSGSSGLPVTVVHDERSQAVLAALNLVRGYLARATPGDLVSRVGRTLTGAERQAWVYITESHSPELVVARRRRRNPRYARQSRIYSILDPLPELVRGLNTYQPTLVGSYPSAIALLAQEQLAGRLRIQPKVVTMAGENLDPSAQAQIREVFGAAVREHYSTAETGQTAFDCSEGWLHVNADWIIIEPVDEALRPIPPGEPSRAVLVTNLANQVQPIIRYRIDDSVVVRPDPCPCHSPLPAMRVQGRIGELLTFPTGAGGMVQVLPLTLHGTARLTPGVQRFQIIQTSPATLTLRIEPSDGFSQQAVFEAVEHRLHEVLSARGITGLTFVRAPEPPAPDPRSGKYRHVWSTVPPRQP